MPPIAAKMSGVAEAERRAEERAPDEHRVQVPEARARRRMPPKAPRRHAATAPQPTRFLTRGDRVGGSGEPNPRAARTTGQTTVRSVIGGSEIQNAAQRSQRDPRDRNAALTRQRAGGSVCGAGRQPKPPPVRASAGERRRTWSWRQVTSATQTRSIRSKFARRSSEMTTLKNGGRSADLCSPSDGAIPTVGKQSTTGPSGQAALTGDHRHVERAGEPGERPEIAIAGSSYAGRRCRRSAPPRG